MTRTELEHAIRAVCDLTDEHEVIVFGSQAILAEHPDAPPELRQSAEADISPLDKAKADLIDGVLGDGSQFHRTHGFYVHGLPIDEAATLPDGWRSRTYALQNANTRNNIGRCVESHDLAASKLVAFRPKDLDFVRVLIVRQMIKPRTLITRLRRLPVAQDVIDRAIQWVDTTVKAAS